MKDIEAALREIELNEGALRIILTSVAAPLIPAAIALDRKTLERALLDWWEAAPGALDLLLTAAAREETDEPALAFARALIPLLHVWTDFAGPWDGIDEVLARAFDRLEPRERDWAAERAGVQGLLHLQPPPPIDTWPDSKRLPPITTLQGVQARLLRLDFRAGPVDGVWSERLEAALWRYQLYVALPPTGEADEETRASLVEIAGA